MWLSLHNQFLRGAASAIQLVRIASLPKKGQSGPHCSGREGFLNGRICFIKENSTKKLFYKTSFDTICTVVCNRCDGSTAYRLSRLETPTFIIIIFHHVYQCVSGISGRLPKVRLNTVSSVFCNIGSMNDSSVRPGI